MRILINLMMITLNLTMDTEVEAEVKKKKNTTEEKPKPSWKVSMKTSISSIRFTNAPLPLPMYLPGKYKEHYCTRCQMEVFQCKTQSTSIVKRLRLSHIILKKLKSSSISHWRVSSSTNHRILASMGLWLLNQKFIRSKSLKRKLFRWPRHSKTTWISLNLMMKEKNSFLTCLKTTFLS